MSLVADDGMASSRPAPVMWTAVTVRPWSAPGTGSCPFMAAVTPRTVTVVLGPGLATLIGTPPIVIEEMLTLPDEPAQVVRDEALTCWMLITGSSRSPMRTSCSLAVAVEVPGATDVTTLAHRSCALTTPLILSTHGGATVVAPAVATSPVSGRGPTVTRPPADRPTACPVIHSTRTLAH